MPKQTPSQTIGPFFEIGLFGAGQNELLRAGAAGDPIHIQGRVLDGDGTPISDALVEIWQADANGVFDHPSDARRAEADPAFRGFGRCETDEAGVFSFQTVKPGAVPLGDGSAQAPHVNVRVFARGMLIQATTRMYFEDVDNESDPVLTSVDAARRPTLIASRAVGEDRACYHFDIRLQGERETVFFDPLTLEDGVG